MNRPKFKSAVSRVKVRGLSALMQLVGQSRHPAATFAKVYYGDRLNLK